ncbi:hypothetical protein ACFLZ1_02395 [Patescibacteria group bacterium]
MLGKKLLKKNKKLVLAVLLLIILVILGLVVFFVKGKSPKNLLNPEAGKNIKKEKFDIKWISWEDPAGFAFEYPFEATVDAHLEDDIYYAFLDIEKPGKEGKITIIVDDSSFVNIDDWLEKDELVKNGSSLDTTIASMSAKKVSLRQGKEITAFIDWDEVIYIIDFQSEDDYLNQVYQHILSSFALTPLEGETEAEFYDWLEGFDTTAADIVESVEVIE